MEAFPPNQTVILKCLNDGVDPVQVKSFILSITPSASFIQVVKDTLQAPDRFTMMAYANYTSEEMARINIKKLDAGIAAWKSNHLGRRDFDLSNCVTFIKSDGYMSINYPVWIGNIMNESLQDLEILFSRFGELNKNIPFPPIRMFERPKRNAIINYSSFQSAQAAMDACHANTVEFGGDDVEQTCALAKARDATKFVLDLRNALQRTDSMDFSQVQELANENNLRGSMWQTILADNCRIFAIDPIRSKVLLTPDDAEAPVRLADAAPAISPSAPSAAALQRTAAAFPATSIRVSRVAAAAERATSAGSAGGGASSRSPPRRIQDTSDAAVNTEAEVDVTCDPVTLQVMRDPVMAADGYTYERCHMEKWLRRRGAVSMMTLAPLQHTFLTPNKAVRDLVEQLHPEVVLAPFVA